MKSLTYNDLDLDDVGYILPSSEGEKMSMPSLPSWEESDLVPLKVLEVPPPTPSRALWLITGLVLMGLNSYFPQLSPVSSLWYPLRAAIPVLHWLASWWFVLLVWEPNLVSLAPLSHIIRKEFPEGSLEEAWESLEVAKNLPKGLLVEVKAAFEELYSDYFAKEGTPVQGN
ncbi:hypothetical protein DSO57_1004549 [Entomophthora muscae]|uniref:Uncharacterized protein n=1 Tax=Entomophthora muscae TaxID=34485 RepID=A0ACC2SAN8_9FUNG|nr:hypothetical protein DSO57_1004549 [Entomophthora muscae]